MAEGIYGIVIIIFVFVFILSQAIKVLREYERGVIFRLGRLIGAKGPGLILLIPMIDKMVKVSLRTVPMDVPPQDIITKDNVTVKVNAVAYFRVMDPNKAIVDVEDYIYATSQIAQTTLRSVLGQVDLDDLLGERDKINRELQTIIDQQTEPWGVKVSVVEVKNVDLPQEMQRAIARQAEAERERRAKVIHADGEVQAAERIHQAASTIGQTPVGIQLRYLQTLVEVAAERNSTTIFPVPIDLFRPFLEGAAKLPGAKQL
jgi:regulator of protease activity HflC (stomatin/prohibitin superfamily)